MAKNKEPRDEKVEHRNAVRNVFRKNNIDLTLVEAGRTLYKSLILAKERTKNRKEYIAKGIKYKFPKSYKRALLEIIQVDKELWESWVRQQEICDTTGDEYLRPTLHRPNPDGNYEFGNIAMLPYGEHLQENAKSVMVLDIDAGTLTTYKTQTEFEDVEGVSSNKTRKIKKALKEAFAQQKQ